MIFETQALEHNNIWELVPLIFKIKTIGYHCVCVCVYAIKVEPNGEVNHLKTWCWPKDTLNGLNYNNTFSLVE